MIPAVEPSRERSALRDEYQLGAKKTGDPLKMPRSDISMISQLTDLAHRITLVKSDLSRLVLQKLFGEEILKLVSLSER